ncbi:MAG TPA: amino acid ABC transporter substrate-binding protein [Oligoflexus sp.]|uniref:amino acid ABC transporter substrate-binding protein n=1 Tax=Oligoflexus sp. TaxID=1971216 RepID=UPI002D54CCF2|nr:amino acid ABC transporter substrate-binding protein [Oligoflexus sp.]HYX35568.1 amino acid ABC transporter substrate-binding protein [Oligoflexus sp.]
MKSFWPSICGLSVLMYSSWLHADTLDEVRKRGFLKCGVSQGLAGFSSPDKAGQWRGIDVDFCRGVAAATLGDANKVKYTSLSAKERFTALQSGEIDLLSRNTSWTIVRDSSLAVDFPGVLYYDGQGFMAPKKLNLKGLKELNGATVCVNLGTTTELNLADYFRSQKMTYKLVAFEKNDEVVAAYDAGRCDVMSSDQSGLYADRTRMKKPEDHVILPEIISKEPLGPGVRHGDNRWADIVRWTLYAMIEAEELKLTAATIEQQKANTNPAVRRLMGLEGDIGKNLGLKPDWALQVIKQVGSYQEIFERNLGKDTPLKIARGQNALWRDGGLQYSMPFR